MSRGRKVGASGESAAAEAYNAGNELLRQGDAQGATQAYDEAVGLAPSFALAYYNRALAHSQLGDEPAALNDLTSAATAGLDEDYFYDAWIRHLRLYGGYSSVVPILDMLDVPAHQRHRLERELSGHVRAIHPILADSPRDGIRFELESLPVRCEMADLLVNLPDADPESIDRILERLAAGVADAEADWRARLVVALVYGSDVLQPTEVIHGVIGLIFDAAQLDLAFTFDSEVARALDAVLSRYVPRERTVTRQVRFARFALAQLEAAADTLVTARRFRLEDRSSAFVQWAVVEDVFRAAIELSLHLEDAGSYHRVVRRARWFAALVDAWRWFDSAPHANWNPAAVRIRLDQLFGPPTPGPSPRLPPRTVVLDYFVFEKATETVAWNAVGGNESRLGSTQIHPDLVADLHSLALQWDDPEAIEREHAGSLSPSGLRRIITRMLLAEQGVPEEYPSAVDESLLGGVREQMGRAERLVVVPWGPLHNIPFHLLSSVRSAADSGSLREILYCPTAMPTAAPTSAMPTDRRAARFLLVAVGEDLPSLAAEVDLIRDLYPAAVMLRDEHATAEHVLDELAECDIVHFACHGEFDHVANSAYLKLHDDRLYPADVLSAQGSMPSLAFLNACVAGVTITAGRNSDAAMGLPHALLAAGSSEVVGPLWRIDDAAALAFADGFFRRWRADVSNTTAAVVQRVQQEMRQKPEFDDLAVWGPYAVWARCPAEDPV